MNLAGTWRLSDADGEYALDINLPGDVHSALLSAGLIPDPYVGTNEKDVQWVGQRTWHMERTITLDALAAARWILYLETVDTVGFIEINGVTVAHSTSMFVPVRIDVTKHLMVGENLLRIVLESPEREAKRRSTLLPYPVPHTEYPIQSPHRNLLRKTQCHSGWDWGPCLMVSGVYGTMTLEKAPPIALLYPRGVPARIGTSDIWELEITAELDATHVPDELISTIQFFLWDQHHRPVAAVSGGQRHENVQGADPGRTVVRATLVVERPDLWWPAGYGEQALYTVEVSLPAANPLTFTTAFRTITVLNEDDAAGRSFSFRVNGRDIWARGANWIPTDALPSRQTGERYRKFLEAAVEANMNMIRVWGGGQYEHEQFYALCDELGLLVWQDCMFSCSLYPAEEWFLAEVREEIEHHVRRLMSHPCIAIWCGNNENVGALTWFPESRENMARYRKDYEQLNTHVVGATVRSLDPTRVFWPSSPAAGEDDFSDNWHDDSKGDMHYWSVWHEGKSFESYYDVTPRFCSEFGFESFPSQHALRTVVGADQMNPTAPEMEHHQRHPRGNTIITETIARYFRVPFSFGDFIYLSQVQQAMAIRMAVDYWRSRRPVSMGALYWQLNDLWPVVSWSSLEYDGRWKILHHEAQRFFAPHRLICQRIGDEQQIWLVNDGMHDLQGTARVRWIQWDGTVEQDIRVSVHAARDTAVAVDQRTIPPADEYRVFLVASWEGEAADDAAETVVPGWTFLTAPKRCTLREPKIQVTTEIGAVTLSCTEAPAFWVVLESDDPRVHFQNNGILLLPGESQRIRLRDEHMLPGTITVRHIEATYRSASRKDTIYAIPNT